MKLGRLKRVRLRDVWVNEAQHFTPWLAEPENLKLLSDAIGIELELEAQEKEVGPFRADLLCRDTVTEAWVLVENQLERTDHTHLGQLITYSAGLRAVTIVWVASTFSDEHRAALDWLNGMTASGVNFFGLEVEVWQIGDSTVAPKFNVVSKPNDWTRSVGEAATRGTLTAAKETQLAFWAAFQVYVAEQETVVRPTKPQPQHWMSMGVGRTGFHLSAIASFFDGEADSYDSHEVRAELVIVHEESKRFYAQLLEQKDAIEAELGYELLWYNPPDKRMCRIYARRTVVDLRDRSLWGELHEWLVRHLEDLQRVFRPLVAHLELTEEDQ